MVRAGFPTTVGGDFEGYVTYEESLNQYDKGSGDSLLDRLVAAAGRVLPKAMNAAKGALAQLSYSGTTGNFQTALEFITLSAKFMQIVPQAPEKIGSPLYQSVMINSLNGFVKTERAVFSSPIATTTEEEAVEAFMNNGFYYE